MGINLFKPSGGSVSTGADTSPPNPNPAKFQVLTGWDFPVSGMCVLVVRYAGCTTYEGRKCLVCKGKVADYVDRAELDPHFTEGGPVVARFAPTVEGNRQARLFCHDADVLKEAYENGRQDEHALLASEAGA
jgi:hypothetical protein